MHEISMDLRRKQAISPNDLPYIDWERPVNEGLGEGHGEGVIVQRQPLFDTKGSPFVWLDESYINGCFQKGWKIVGYGNFDRIMRHDGQPHEQLVAIWPLVEGRARDSQEIAMLRAQNEQLKAERAQLIKERAQLLAAPKADFRTEEEKVAGSVSVVLDQGATAGSEQAPAESGEPAPAPAAGGATEEAKGKNGKAK